MQPHEILEELSHRGYAPCLLYDDDGSWIVTDSGISPMSEKGNLACFVENGSIWHPTIIEAVNAYLKETGEEL